MPRKVCVLSSLVIALALTSLAQESRRFTFHYAFTVKGLPNGKKVRIWIPAAQTDPYQEVKVVSVRGDLPMKKNRESKYGIEIYFAEAVASQPNCTSTLSTTSCVMSGWR